MKSLCFKMPPLEHNLGALSGLKIRRLLIDFALVVCSKVGDIFMVTRLGTSVLSGWLPIAGGVLFLVLHSFSLVGSMFNKSVGLGI